MTPNPDPALKPPILTAEMARAMQANEYNNVRFEDVVSAEEWDALAAIAEGRCLVVPASPALPYGAKSKSEAKRIASMRGDPAPEFGVIAPPASPGPGVEAISFDGLTLYIAGIWIGTLTPDGKTAIQTALRQPKGREGVAIAGAAYDVLVAALRAAEKERDELRAALAIWVPETK